MYHRGSPDGAYRQTTSGSKVARGLAARRPTDERLRPRFERSDAGADGIPGEGLVRGRVAGCLAGCGYKDWPRECRQENEGSDLTRYWPRLSPLRLSWLSTAS
jgi:hypothetical protein